MKAEIYYGKADVATYRTYASPLTDITPIPESSFEGRSNTLLAAEIEVQVLGTAFMAAYTEGDNRLVVATDTMKNFIHRESLAFDGATLEEWLLFIGRRFLETYPDMERLRVNGVEIPFEPALVPAADGDGFESSEVLFARQHGDRSNARLELGRSSDGSVEVTDLAAGRQGLQLMKVTGSAFADFARDEYTTLPERRDRPLYIHMDIGWRYGSPAIGVAADHAQYVSGEQVADLAAAVFHRFVSLSIQHLVNEIGTTMLERWPQLAEVSFESQNRLWDLAVTSEDDERLKVYCDPR
ncbi:MAG TPA: urate oxidase, partial [Candidatus Limnocylindrales bacterium]|nr:urate oxidase [Candidatus Limnocylindrales bacterium]